eukprot:m51a1_g7922 hypothetical protein (872) ;mRNA; r:4331-8572
MRLLRLFSLLALALAAPTHGQQLSDAPEWPSTRLAELVPGSASGARGHAVPLPDAPVRLYDAGTTAPAGDVDGDGAVDVVAGGCGAVHVVLGPVGASVALPRAVAEGRALRIDAPRCPCGAKVTVESAGDINCDGVGDVAVVCGASDGSSAAYVLLGRRRPAPWPSSLDDRGPRALVVALAGPVARVAAVGDVNGDNCTDVAVALRPSARSVRVVYGRPTAQWPPVLDTERLGPSEGFAVPGVATFAGVGDVDGDAVDDVVGFAIAGDAGAGGLGFAVSAAGDVNGDGIDDVLVGAVQTRLPLSASDVMASSRRPLRITGARGYVLLGRRQWPHSVPVTSLAGTDGFAVDGVLSGLSEVSSVALSGVGDVNADGYADFALGSSGQNWTVSVVFGRASWGPAFSVLLLDGTNGCTVSASVSTFATPASTISVAGVGDVNGDGVGELAIGTSTGRSYVVFGHEGTWPAVADPAHMADASELWSGNVRQVASADVNGDGLSDVVCLCTASFGFPMRVVVAFGNRLWRPSLYSVHIGDDMVVSGDGVMRLHGSVSSAGDRDGDGVDDLVIGTVEHRNGTGRAWVVYGSRAPRVVRPIQDCPYCCRARVGARYAFTVPADTCAQDSDPAPLALNASWSRAIYDAFRTYSNDWLSFDNATGSFSGVPTHAGSLRVEVSCINARGVRARQIFSLYVASSIEVSIGDNSGKVTFGGEKSGETQLAPIVVNSTGSRVQVSITAAAKTMRSREHSDDVVVWNGDVTWTANGTVAGVNRLLSRFVFGHYFTQNSVDFTLRAEDDLGGFCRAQWSAMRDGKDRDDPSSVYYYYNFLVIGLPVAAGVGILMLGGHALVSCIRRRRQRDHQRDQVFEDDINMTEN